MQGRVHNSALATRGGSDCWVASIVNDDGLFVGGIDDVEEFDTETDAVDWCRRELRTRGGQPRINLDDGSWVRTDLPRKTSQAEERERQMPALFTMRLQLTGEEPLELPYDSIESCLDDEGLKTLFGAGHVERCEVFCGTKRITALAVQEWPRLKDSLISNSVAILRQRGDGHDAQT